MPKKNFTRSLSRARSVFHSIGPLFSTPQDNIFDLLRRLTVSVHPASRSGCFGWCACVTDKERNERDERRERGTRSFGTYYDTPRRYDADNFPCVTVSFPPSTHNCSHKSTQRARGISCDLRSAQEDDDNSRRLLQRGSARSVVLNRGCLSLQLLRTTRRISSP